MLKKKIWTSFQRIIELLTQKFALSFKQYRVGIRDPRSGIRKKPLPDPRSGSRGQKGTGSRIRNTAIFKDPYNVFSKKLLSNIWVWDPGSEIRNPEKIYSGSWIQGSKCTGSPIWIRKTVKTTQNSA
jgi:hypothetical protein